MAHNYEIRESPGRGLGSFALVDIPRGTRLTFEKPLLITGTDENGQYAARTTFEAFQAMSKSKQEAYLKLHPSPRVFEEFRSGIQIDAGGMTKEMKEYIAYICAIRSANSYGHGVYELASRFNHSCTPNCNASGNSAETICVHSVRDVKAGEELTVYYMDPEQTREARQEFLVNYGFVCDCPACDLSTPQGKRSEERRAQIWRLKQDVNFMKERDWNKVVGPYAPSVSTLSGNSDPESALRTLESLLKEEGLVGNNLSAWWVLANVNVFVYSNFLCYTLGTSLVFIIR
jgi:hypothetical protein